MRLIHNSLFAAIAAIGLTACNKPADAPAADPATATPPIAETARTTEAPPAMTSEAHANHTAVADLAPTQGNDVKGNVTFSVVDGKVHVKGQVSGLKPNSEHGFHIHEKGDCSAPNGDSAGGHFNPSKEDHGNVATTPHHGGDIPNIKADAQGNAVVDAAVSTNVNIGEGNDSDIIGRGLIVHADPDDYKTQPTGNAGARLACAVIKAAP